MEMKLVSVYIPTHNRCLLLKRAIDSVLNQSYEKIEILVCDDGSSDATKEFVEDYQKIYPQIIYLHNEKPKGACAARNLGINKAQGYYITGLDDDDEFLPNRIDDFVKFYECNDYAYLSSAIIYDHGNYRTTGYAKKSNINVGGLLFNNLVGNQVFTKTEYLLSIGGFDEEFQAWQDYDTWLRLTIRYGTGFNTKKPTYIQHLSHEFDRITNSKKLKEGYQQFIEKHSNLLSKKHKKSLEFNYLAAIGKRLTLKQYLKLCSINNAIDLLKYQIKKTIPFKYNVK